MIGNEWLPDWHLHMWVPWLLATGNVSSLCLTMNKRRSGFTVLIVTQVAFVAYAVATGQAGFILQNLAMVLVATVAWHKWRPPGEVAPVDDPAVVEPTSPGYQAQ